MFCQSCEEAETTGNNRICDECWSEDIQENTARRNLTTISPHIQGVGRCYGRRHRVVKLSVPDPRNKGSLMGIKFYNYSGLPDEPQLEILKIAKMAVNCPGNVAVITERPSCKDCTATRGRFIYRSVVGLEGYGKIQTDYGCINIHPFVDVLRRSSTQQNDWPEISRRFFRTAVHEFTHIKDYANKKSDRLDEYRAHASVNRQWERFKKNEKLQKLLIGFARQLKRRWE